MSLDLMRSSHRVGMNNEMFGRVSTSEIRVLYMISLAIGTTLQRDVFSFHPVPRCKCAPITQLLIRFEFRGTFDILNPGK